MEPDDSGHDSPVPRPEHPAARQRGELEWRDHFALEEGDLEKVPLLEVMLEDHGIAGFLKGEGGAGKKDKTRSLLVGLAAVAAAAAIAVGGSWDLFKYRIQPEIQVVRPPAALQMDVPADYRADVDAINRAFADGNNESAYSELAGLRKRLAADTIHGLDPLRERVYTELLILARSTNKPYAEAKNWYGELAAVAGKRGPGRPRHPDFRAMEAFILLTEQDGREPETLLNLLETMRNEYGQQMNLNRALLQTEAESHMAALPKVLHTEPDFSQHWRRIFAAVKAFGDLGGSHDEAGVALRLKMWETMYECFRWPRIGEERTITVDKIDYTLKDVVERIASLKDELRKIRRLPKA